MVISDIATSILLSAKCLFYIVISSRIGDNFEAVFAALDILSTCIQSDHHQIILAHTGFGANCEDTFLFEHVAYAAAGTQVAAVLREYVTYIGSGTVTVIGQAADPS